MFIAILRRTNEYGITERRYFVFVLAVWLAGIALYFTFSKAKNIKFIPISLCIISFLSSFGPWSAFSVSEKSQVSRLESILKENKILIDGKIIKTDSKVPDKKKKEVSSVINYLAEHNSLSKIQPWFEINIDNLKDTLINGVLKNKEAVIVEQMGLEYYSPWTYQTDKSFNYSLKDYNSFGLKEL